MGLNENIDRIIEVMGINESRNVEFFKRRQKMFSEEVLSSMPHISAIPYDNFRDYVDDVVDEVITMFFLHHIDEAESLPSPEERGRMHLIFSNTLARDKDLFETIRSYFYRKNHHPRMNESKVNNSLKRRIPELIKSVVNIAEILHVPRWYDSFLGFMETAVFHAIRNAEEGELDQETFDRVQYYLMGIIERDDELYKKLRDIFDRKISRL
jgi:hypothetical protein